GGRGGWGGAGWGGASRTRRGRGRRGAAGGGGGDPPPPNPASTRAWVRSSTFVTALTASPSLPGTDSSSGDTDRGSGTGGISTRAYPPPGRRPVSRPRRGPGQRGGGPPPAPPGARGRGT